MILREVLVFDWLSASLTQKLDHIFAFSGLDDELFILDLASLRQLLKVVFGATTRLLLLLLKHVGKEEASQLALVLHFDALLRVDEHFLSLLLVIDLLLKFSCVDIVCDLSITVIFEAIL